MNDLTDMRFGSLTVIKRAPDHIASSGRKYTMWLCQCDCGNECICYSDHLTRGNTKSCGCGRYSTGEKHPNYKHGGYHSRLYRIWQGMKRRCYCDYSEDWGLYGGRGIKMCDEWKDDFSSFQKWAIENGYDEMAQKMQCTIDRIDVNGNYCPENCRWATMKEQCNNYRRNINITYCGETHTLMQWSEIIGFPYKKVHQRMKRGWSFEKAVEEYV